MKILFAVLSFLVVAQARAADFQTTAIYCNGPVSNGDVSSCPAFSLFMGVALKDLKSVSIPMNSTDSLIRLEDAFGNIWEQQLETCKSRPSNIRGCSAKVDLTNPEQVEVHISIWDIGHRIQNLAIFIKKNQLSLVTDGGDSLMFSLTDR